MVNSFYNNNAITFEFIQRTLCHHLGAKDALLLLTFIFLPLLSVIFSCFRSRKKNRKHRKSLRNKYKPKKAISLAAEPVNRKNKRRPDAQTQFSSNGNVQSNNSDKTAKRIPNYFFFDRMEGTNEKSGLGTDEIADKSANLDSAPHDDIKKMGEEGSDLFDLTPQHLKPPSSEARDKNDKKLPQQQKKKLLFMNKFGALIESKPRAIDDKHATKTSINYEKDSSRSGYEKKVQMIHKTFADPSSISEKENFDEL